MGRGREREEEEEARALVIEAGNKSLGIPAVIHYRRNLGAKGDDVKIQNFTLQPSRSLHIPKIP